MGFDHQIDKELRHHRHSIYLHRSCAKDLSLLLKYLRMLILYNDVVSTGSDSSARIQPRLTLKNRDVNLKNRLNRLNRRNLNEMSHCFHYCCRSHCRCCLCCCRWRSRCCQKSLYQNRSFHCCHHCFHHCFHHCCRRLDHHRHRRRGACRDRVRRSRMSHQSA